MRRVHVSLLMHADSLKTIHEEARKDVRIGDERDQLHDRKQVLSLIRSKRVSSEVSADLLERAPTLTRELTRIRAWSESREETMMRESFVNHYMIKNTRHARYYDLYVLAEWCQRRCSSLHFDRRPRAYHSHSSQQLPDFIAEHRMKCTS
jgi:hypothetical protein